MFNPEPSQSKQ